MNAAEGTAMNAKKAKVEILIADDEAEMRNLLAAILRSRGYSNIEHAADGVQASMALERAAPAPRLAFLDINMPGRSGIEVLVRAQTSRPACFCVMVSGKSAMESVLSALGKGARGFVVKPYNIKKITDVLDKFEREVGL
ncbi:MAG: response regulator [Burkholderiaceae bacterium]|nr:response regulator [Burkholderiaceae bacterium]